MEGDPITTTTTSTTSTLSEFSTNLLQGDQPIGVHLMSATGDNTLMYARGAFEDRKKAEDALPSDTQERITLYMSMTEKIMQSANPEEAYAELPRSERDKLKLMAMEFTEWGNDEVLFRAGEKLETIKKDVDISNIKATLTFEPPEDLTDNSAKATAYFMEEYSPGALTKYNDMSRQMIAQGGRKAVPTLYESQLKETMDALNISKTEAAIGLDLAQTQTYYDNIAKGRFVDETSGSPVNYSTSQNTSIARIGSRMASAGFGFKFTGESVNPTGFNMNKKDYSKEEWSEIGSAISEANSFLATNTNVGRKLIGELKIPQGQFKGETMPVYAIVGEFQGDLTGAPTNTGDVDSALGL